MELFEQEVASAARFILDAVGACSPYYWEIREDFSVPAVYFPMPKIETAGDAVDTYRMSYTWFVKCFAVTTQDAHQMALRALVAIKEARNCIPLIDTDGSVLQRRFRLKDPKIDGVERGAWQITLNWDSPRWLSKTSGPLVQKFHINDWERPDINAEKTLQVICETAQQKYPYCFPVPETLHPQLGI